MAEAPLSLDLTDAFASLEDLDAQFDAIADNFSASLTDGLQAALDSVDVTHIGDDLSHALDTAATDVHIDIPEPDISGVQDALGSVGDTMGDVQTSSEEMSGGIDGAGIAALGLGGNIGGMIGKVLPVALVFGGITAAVHSLIESADEAAVSKTRMDDAFGKVDALNVVNDKILGTTFSIEDLNTKTGTSSTKMREQLATFGLMGKSAGYSADAVKLNSEAFGGLVHALAVANPALGTADRQAQTLMRGFAGSPRILQRYGITMDQARLKIDALNLAHAHGRDTASQYDKQMAGMAQVTEQVTKRASDLGLTVDQYLNQKVDQSTFKFRALAKETKVALVGIGEPLVELGLQIATALEPLTVGLIKILGGLMRMILPVVAGIVKAFAAVATPVIDLFVKATAPLAHVFDGVTVGAKGFGDALSPLSRVWDNMISPAVIGFFKGAAEGIHELALEAAKAVGWLGDHLSPAFRNLLPGGGKASADQISHIAESIGRIAGPAAAAALAIVTVSKSMSVLGKAFGALQTVGKGVTGLFALGPIGIAAVAIAAIGTAAFLAYKHFKPFRDIVDQTGRVVMQTLKPALDAISNFDLGGAINDATDSVTGFYTALSKAKPGEGGGVFKVGKDIVTEIQGIDWGSALASVADALKPLGDVFEQVGKRIGPLVETLGHAIGPAIEKIGSKIDEVLPKVEKIAVAFYNVGKVLLGPVLLAMQTMWTFMANEIGPVFDLIGRQAVTTWTAIADIITGAIDVIVGIVSFFIDVFTGDWGAAWDDIKEIVRGVWQIIQGTINLALGTIENVIQFALGTIGALFKAGWFALKAVVEVVFNVISGIVSAVWNTIVGVFRDQVNTIVGVVRFAWNVISSVVRTEMNIIVGIVTGVWNTVRSVFTAAWNFLRATVVNGISNVVTAIRGLQERILGVFSGAVRWLYQAGKDIVEGLINGIKAIWHRVEDTLTDLASHLPGFIKGPLGIGSPSKVFHDLGTNITDGLKNGLDAGASSVADSMSGIAGAVKDSGQSIIDNAGGIDDALREAVNGDSIDLGGIQAKMAESVTSMQTFQANIQQAVSEGNPLIAAELAKLGPQSGAALSASLAASAPEVRRGFEMQLAGQQAAYAAATAAAVLAVPAFSHSGYLIGQGLAQGFVLGSTPISSVTVGQVATVQGILAHDTSVMNAGAFMGSHATDKYKESLKLAGVSDETITQAEKVVSADQKLKKGHRVLGDNASKAFQTALLLAGMTQTELDNAGTILSTSPGRRSVVLKALGLGSDAGGSFGEGLASGIHGATSKVTSAMNRVLDAAIAKAKADHGIKSPSTETARLIGEPLGLGIAEGIRSTYGEIESALTGAVKVATPDKMALTGDVGRLSKGGGGGATIAPHIEVHVAAQPGMSLVDAQSIGETVGKSAHREIIATIRSI